MTSALRARLTRTLAPGAAMILAAVGLASFPAHAAGSADPVVMAVGDIACDPDQAGFNNGLGTPAGCRQKWVGDAVRAQQPDAFLPLGDNQYFDGRYAAFMASYDKAFGDLNPISYPIPGNHEYKVPRGADYYRYFGARAHQESKGTYSFDIGSWHFIAINSTQCTASKPCGPGSPMARWIAADVAAHPAQCMAAMWHHPLWSAGAHGAYSPMAPVWNQLNDYGVDLVLTGHDHLYQRFLPAGPARVEGGVPLPPTVTPGGMVQFVVGTGGEDNYSAKGLKDPSMASALAAVGTNPSPGVFGALRLALHSDGYDFSFVNAVGSSFSDSGSASCRTKNAATGAPSKPTALRVARAGDGAVKVTWQPATSILPEPISYTVAPVGSARRCVVEAATSCTVAGLANGREYRFTVQAGNSVADTLSDPSDPIVVATRPGRPTGVSALATAPGAARINWIAPASTGGLPITGYTVTANKGGAQCTTTGTTSCTISGLKAGSGYSFTVVARTAAGDSPASVGTASLRVN